MISILQKHIKTTIAQTTQMFNLETQNITANLNSNIISNTGLDDGEWTLSEAVDGVASKGCVNDTFEFIGGLVTTDNFLGNDNLEVNLVAQKVNVGTAIARELAVEMLKDTKTPNSIIIYTNTANNTSTDTITSLSEDFTLNVRYTIGVIFKIKASDMESIGCINTDVAFIRSVIGIGKNTGTMIKFESLKSRFYVGDDYCVEFEFSYEDIMDLDDTIISRLQHFDSELSLTTN